MPGYMVTGRTNRKIACQFTSFEIDGEPVGSGFCVNTRFYDYGPSNSRRYIMREKIDRDVTHPTAGTPIAATVFARKNTRN
jgi:hypothetical protein